ncbi:MULTISPECIES: hypothetical protein [unclassified Pseudomonas]|uniref:hypothetical protein n=1 Tax=unclassified Pseudomonas TaxID=196821 RepID=UPI000C88CDF3|nr:MULTISPECIES: hypothetical protein [unclassified Pseudomonas]PNA93641.1 hypothetical protein C1X74_21025 [Pseudomonas sp. GW460-5]PNB56159.1 hypothetical protein C1X73_20045 [Pseudomonas sp. FW305-130]
MQKTNLFVVFDGKSFAGWSFEELPLAAARLLACGQIDQAADAGRSSVLGDPLRALEYQIAADEATAFAASVYAGDPPPTVQAWMDATGMDAQPATDSILTEAAAWKEAMYLIRSLRLKGKQDVLKALDHVAIEAITDTAIEAIQASVRGIGNN